MTVRTANSDAPLAPAHRVIYFDDSLSVAQGLKAGDTDALEAFYNIYAPYVRKVLARILGATTAELEDCLQETFTTAFYKAGQIKNPEHLKTWITRIAINRALDTIRKRNRESWLQFWAPEKIPDICFMSSSLEDKEAVEAVYQILDALPAQERIPFVLRRMERMPLADIANVTNVSLATTKRRIASAQQRFERLAQSYEQLETWLNENGRWRLS
ncbi:MAG: sigma-70 family RNA polymerase sigma factor [Deltaproteobacteria bacterium]|nr:sigma-70 family RNA polymerase sigma factor [Deltaproteobacteria bacterium]MBN2674037.1 sigma-70 family RNA polymerase sigma factor [Deltaproteobacteria bacterium]